jgi:hypothetical protein
MFQNDGRCFSPSFFSRVHTCTFTASFVSRLRFYLTTPLPRLGRGFASSKELQGLLFRDALTTDHLGQRTGPTHAHRNGQPMHASSGVSCPLTTGAGDPLDVGATRSRWRAVYVSSSAAHFPFSKKPRWTPRKNYRSCIMLNYAHVLHHVDSAEGLVGGWGVLSISSSTPCHSPFVLARFPRLRAVKGCVGGGESYYLLFNPVSLPFVLARLPRLRAAEGRVRQSRDAAEGRV